MSKQINDKRYGQRVEEKLIIEDDHNSSHIQVCTFFISDLSLYLHVSV